MKSALHYDEFFNYIDSFVDDKTTIYESSEQTLKTNIRDIRLFKEFMTAEEKVQITGSLVLRYQRYLKQIRCNCGASINRKLFSLRSYSKYLENKDIKNAEKLPFSEVLKIRGGYRGKPNALSVEQVHQFFKKIDRNTVLGLRDYCIYTFMYNLGLRVGEVYSLDLGDVDLENKEITVMGKGRRRRTLPIPKEVVRVIKTYLIIRELFLNADEISAFFISKKGNRLAIRTMEANFKKLIMASGISTYFNVTCHTLRHSFASHLHDSGTDILVLQSLMGHNSPRSTECYIHPSINIMREAIEKMPVVKYVRMLVDIGAIKFQKKSKIGIVVNAKKMKQAINRV